MKISVVIVTYNSSEFIEKCVMSVQSQNQDEIIIIDNASTDKTLELILEKFPDIHLIKSSKNLGYATANNLGIKIALENDPDYVLILNPDTLLQPKTIQTLINAALKYDNQGIFGPKILDKTGKIWSLGGSLDKNRYTAKLIGFNTIDRKQKQVNKCDFVSGTCMLLPKKILDTGIRFYDPYFLYYEDVEFCVKSHQLGFHSYCVTAAKIEHLETSVKSLENIKNYYLARNHLLFVERNSPFRVKLREFIRWPKTIWEHYQKQERFGFEGVTDYLLKKFGSYAAKT